jgi:hypothetical protein
MVERVERNSTLEDDMKRLLVLGLLLAVVACAQQEAPPPAAAPPPPPVAAAPPPPAPPPPPPMTLASFDGRYAGTATVEASGVQTQSTTNPLCVEGRPLDMTIHNGFVTIWYHNWKRNKLHYRGHIDASGKILVSHLNGDGSRSVFTLQMQSDSANGQMQRGDCWYTVSFSRA